jgi:hypothetical protein
MNTLGEDYYYKAQEKTIDIFGATIYMLTAKQLEEGYSKGIKINEAHIYTELPDYSLQSIIAPALVSTQGKVIYKER